MANSLPTKLALSLFNSDQEGTFAYELRYKRFQFFKGLLLQANLMDEPLNILDVGGTQVFWERMHFTDNPKIHITITNKTDDQLARKAVGVEGKPNFSVLRANALEMSDIPDNTYDVVFSNSVIEHVETFENQKLMANTIRRIGKRYFVQTPNINFPIEPHFYLPWFQFYPLTLKTFLMQHLNWFALKAIKDRDIAEAAVREVRLLEKNEMQELFPESDIFEEKCLSLTKSYVAYFGF